MMRKSLLLAALLAGACSSPPPVAPVYTPSPTPIAAAPSHAGNVTRVPLIPRSSGTFDIAVAIDGVCCFPFVLDTGASDVSVSPRLFIAMRQGNRVKDSDLMDVVSYNTANGVTAGVRFRMPPITVGTRGVPDGMVTARNVVGSVSEGNMLLLGQSFLRKFKSWSIDNEHHQLVLNW